MHWLAMTMRGLSRFKKPACSKVTQQSQCHADVFGFGQLLSPGLSRSGTRKSPVALNACVARDIGGSREGATFVLYHGVRMHFCFKAEAAPHLSNTDVRAR